jgi:hypothetical protein
VTCFCEYSGGPFGSLNAHNSMRGWISTEGRRRLSFLSELGVLSVNKYYGPRSL